MNRMRFNEEDSASCLNVDKEKITPFSNRIINNLQKHSKIICMYFLIIHVVFLKIAT